MLNFLRKLFEGPVRARAQQLETELLREFEVYWSRHSSTPDDRERVAVLIHQRVSMTSPDVVEAMLDRRVPPLKKAGVLDKIVDQVYGGSSSFFLKHLVG